MTAAPVPGVTLKTAKANNIHMRYAEIGSGPLVVFAHGWPESWYSWRHQLTAVSAAGFRCVAPDMRGYGGTEAPEPIDQYTLLHMVGDMAELTKALGEPGHHRWPRLGRAGCLARGAVAADLFPAVCAMSVPYAPPGYVDILTALEKLGINDFTCSISRSPAWPRPSCSRTSAAPCAAYLRRRRLQEKGKGLPG
jgi:pimeloyl-ACP methyl ester carboxylesterase